MPKPNRAQVCLAACAEKLPPELRLDVPKDATLDNTHWILRAALATSALGPAAALEYLESWLTGIPLTCGAARLLNYTRRANSYNHNIVGLFGWHVATDPHGAAKALQTTWRILEKGSGIPPGDNPAAHRYLVAALTGTYDLQDAELTEFAYRYSRIAPRAELKTRAHLEEKEQ